MSHEVRKSGPLADGASVSWLEGLLLALAGGAGLLIVQDGLGSLTPLLLGLAGVLLVCFSVRQPFFKTFSLYTALAAFNYYYFYCARFTGRNPTDIKGFGIPATPMELMQKDVVFLLLLGLGLVKLFTGLMEGYPLWSRRLTHPLFRVILLFGVFSVIHGIYWVFEGESLFNILHYVRSNIEYALIPVLLCTALVRSENQLSTILKAMLYTLPVVALLGIVEVLIGGALYERSFYGGSLFLRAASTLQNPNNLGAYLSTMMGVFCVYFAYGKLARFERWLFFPSMGMGLVCLFMTFSRSSILSFFIMVSLCCLLYFMAMRQSGTVHDKFSRILKSYGVLMLVSLLVLFKYFDFMNAVRDAVELYLDSTMPVSHNRLFALPVAFGILLNNPVGALIGYGRSLYDASDNTFATIVVQNGLIGFTLYAVIWFMALKESIKGVLQGQAGRMYLFMAAFFLIGYQFLHGFTSLIYKAFPHNMYFWFAVGLVIWLNSRPAQGASDDERAGDDAPAR